MSAIAFRTRMSPALQVYIVEDSPLIRELLASAIASTGAEVCGCSGDAQEAIADAFALQPDLMLIDISLLSGNGFDVLKALQEHNLVPGALKVVLTNHANPECEAFSARLGADRFFDKSLEWAQALAFIAAKAAEKRDRAAAPAATESALS